MNIVSTMVVMLIWVGPGNGGPAVVPGFETLAACEMARPKVEKVYGIDPNAFLKGGFTFCAELPSAVAPKTTDERAEYERLKHKFEPPAGDAK